MGFAEWFTSSVRTRFLVNDLLRLAFFLPLGGALAKEGSSGDG